MKTLINLSHVIPNTEGRIQKRRITIAGRLLTPGAQATFEETPAEALPLVHDETRNPTGFLRLVEEPQVRATRDADHTEHAEPPAGTEQPESTEETGGAIEETGSGHEAETPQTAPSDDDGPPADGAGPASADTPSTPAEAESQQPSEPATATTTASQGERSTDLHPRTAASRVSEIDSVEEVERFVEGDHRASVLRAAQEQKEKLQTAESPEASAS